MSVAAIAVVVLLIFVIPVFQGMFASVGLSLPLPTRIVIGMSNVLQSYWYLIGGAGYGAVFAIQRYYATPGGRLTLFCPNRLYPFETHGHYWRGQYHFGNTPLINWLPNPLRNRLAPHVRAYTSAGLLGLFAGQPVRVVHHSIVYPGFDNVVARRPGLGRMVRRVLYALEHTPLQAFGLSHFLVLERLPG